MTIYTNLVNVTARASIACDQIGQTAKATATTVCGPVTTALGQFADDVREAKHELIEKQYVKSSTDRTVRKVKDLNLGKRVDDLQPLELKEFDPVF
jgi:hypothetical protein